MSKLARYPFLDATGLRQFRVISSHPHYAIAADTRGVMSQLSIISNRAPSSSHSSLGL